MLHCLKILFYFYIYILLLLWISYLLISQYHTLWSKHFTKLTLFHAAWFFLIFEDFFQSCGHYAKFWNQSTYWWLILLLSGAKIYLTLFNVYSCDWARLHPWNFIVEQCDVIYTEDDLKVEQLLELIDKGNIGGHALPSPLWSSDHIALMASFSYKQGNISQQISVPQNPWEGKTPGLKLLLMEEFGEDTAYTSRHCKVLS